MAKVSLKHIYKVYDGKVKAVNDFNLEIEDKEFIVFVGPSGCGKSTTLRMVAGLEEISAGELWIGDTLCNHIEPKNRNISMVFQNYALFPNMTVYDNIAFGLKMHKVPKAEIDKRVKEAAEILGITEYLDRKPKALSGGQRQRVALGRAIVREPNVFLFDEPLSNLDAKLRAKMRTEITRLHKRLQTTFIYVTHDQVEAMTMGDRIVVMKGGFVQQIDTPQNLFRWPENKFVAGFIGTPQMNFFSATLKREKNGNVTVTTKDFTLTLPPEETYRLDETYLDGEKLVTLGVRPDDIKPVERAANGAEIRARVALVEELGTQTLIYANTNAEELMEENSATAFCSCAGENSGVLAEQEVVFEVNTSKLHFFDAETEQTIKHRIPAAVTVSGLVKNKTIDLLGSTQTLPDALNGKLAEGEYQIDIPTKAVVFSDKGCAGVIEGIDALGKDGYLYRVCCGKDRIFLIDEKQHNVGENIYIDIVFDKLTFIGNGGKVVNAISDICRFSGKFLRLKEGKEKKHFIEIGGVKIETPLEFNQKMYDRGRTIFKKNLSFETDASAVKIGGEGVPVMVEEVLDYGDKKYARVCLDEIKFYVTVGSELLEKNVSIKFDFDAIRVYDSDIDMRLF